jgi:hypothetical protein
MQLRPSSYWWANNMAHITATNMYDDRFPPPGAKKAYIARLTGRDAKSHFAREFLGHGKIDIYEAGLYEARSVDKKGRAFEPEYYVVLILGDDAIRYKIDYSRALKIAREIDNDRKLEDIVDLVNGVIVIRSAAKAAKAKQDETIAEAIETCIAILRPHNDRQKRKALRQIKAVLFQPPKG